MANHVRDKISLEKIMMISPKFSIPLAAELASALPKTFPRHKERSMCLLVEKEEERIFSKSKTSKGINSAD